MSCDNTWESAQQGVLYTHKFSEVIFFCFSWGVWWKTRERGQGGGGGGSSIKHNLIVNVHLVRIVNLSHNFVVNCADIVLHDINIVIC